MFIFNAFSTCFGHHYVHLQENKTCVTACVVLRYFCWMWLVEVVGRCVVGCEHSEGYCSTVLRCGVRALWRLLFDCAALWGGSTVKVTVRLCCVVGWEHCEAYFTVLPPHIAAQSNSNLHSARTPQRSVPQPLPTTSSRTSAAQHMQ